MKTRPISSLLLTALFVLTLSSCGKKTETAMVDTGAPPTPPANLWQVNYSNTPNPAITCGPVASPNGNLAYLAFEYIVHPPPPGSMVPTDSIAYSGPVGVQNRALLCFPKPGSSENYDTSVVLLNGPLMIQTYPKALIIPQYKMRGTPNWTCYDSVTVTDTTGIVPQSKQITTTGAKYAAAYKSMDGTQTASVVIVVVGTGTAPALPPGKK